LNYGSLRREVLIVGWVSEALPFMGATNDGHAHAETKWMFAAWMYNYEGSQRQATD